MRFDDVYIAGAGSWLPPSQPAESALAAGETDLGTLRLTAATGVTVATRADETPAEMGSRAARTALRRAGLQDAPVDLVLHACTYDQQHDMWAPASYIQRAVVRGRCPAIEVRQVSNGGMAALALAVAYLRAQAGRTTALITTGDRFAAPGFDRWRSDPGTVYADGGTAVAVSLRTGFARLRSLVLESDAELEGMHRTGPAAGPAPLTERTTRPVVDLGGAAKGFLGQVGHSFAISRMAAAQRDVLKTALAEADTTLEEIEHLVVPHFGRRRLEPFVRSLDLDLGRTTWSWSRSVGHLGAGDQFAGLDHLTATGALSAGQRVLLLGVGAGFSWSAAVLEILARPVV